MKIGILSDSHDNFSGLLNAIEVFSRKKAGMIFHDGDIIAPGMCYAFHGCDADVRLVFGNNDGDRIEIKRDFEAEGALVLGDFGEEEVDGRMIAMTHRTDEPLVSGLVKLGIHYTFNRNFILSQSYTYRFLGLT